MYCTCPHAHKTMAWYVSFLRTPGPDWQQSHCLLLIVYHSKVHQTINEPHLPVKSMA